MFCPKCGNEVDDNAKFCGSCGNNIEVATSDTSNESNVEEISAIVLEDDASTEENTGPGTSFLNGLESATDYVEDSPSTGNELLDKLVAFKNLFHAYMNNCRILIQWSERQQALKEVGFQWYYDNIDDPVINSSKQIDSKLASAKKSLEVAESNIKSNAQERKKAEDQYDAVRAIAQGSTHEVIKKERSNMRAGIIIAVAAVLLFLFVGLPSMMMNPQSALDGGVFGQLIVYIGAAVFGVWWYKRKKANAKKAEDKTIGSAQASFNVKYERIAEKDRQLTAQIRDLRESIKQLTPVAGEIKHDAIERAKYYYESDLLALQEGMLKTATICQSQYNQMKDSKVLTSESDWYQIDDLVRYVESGRADSLKEALQLLDTSNYRESNLEYQKQIVKGVKISTEVQAEGFARLLEEQQAVISSLQSGFNDLSTQAARHHAEEVALQAAEIAMQSQVVSEQSKQTSVLNNISSNSDKQVDFNQEVRDRMNWTDANRPDSVDVQRDRFNSPIFGKSRK